MIIRVVILAFLLVTSSVAAAGYSRDAFPHWSDFDRDGLHTRLEIIQEAAIRDGVWWVCRYTGQVFTDPSRMDLDHIVPLAWAWRHGADRWTRARREQFANDPDNLILVSAAANRAKGDQGPDLWIPPNITFVPTYITRFQKVCDKYGIDLGEAVYADIAARFEPMRNGIRPEDYK